MSANFYCSNFNLWQKSCHRLKLAQFVPTLICRRLCLRHHWGQQEDCWHQHLRPTTPRPLLPKSPHALLLGSGDKYSLREIMGKDYSESNVHVRSFDNVLQAMHRDKIKADASGLLWGKPYKILIEKRPTGTPNCSSQLWTTVVMHITSTTRW